MLGGCRNTPTRKSSALLAACFFSVRSCNRHLDYKIPSEIGLRHYRRTEPITGRFPINQTDEVTVTNYDRCVWFSILSSGTADDELSLAGTMSASDVSNTKTRQYKNHLHGGKIYQLSACMKPVSSVRRHSHATTPTQLQQLLPTVSHAPEKMNLSYWNMHKRYDNALPITLKKWRMVNLVNEREWLLRVIFATAMFGWRFGIVVMRWSWSTKLLYLEPG